MTYCMQHACIVLTALTYCQRTTVPQWAMLQSLTLIEWFDFVQPPLKTTTLEVFKHSTVQPVLYFKFLDRQKTHCSSHDIEGIWACRLTMCDICSIVSKWRGKTIFKTFLNWTTTWERLKWGSALSKSASLALPTNTSVICTIHVYSGFASYFNTVRYSVSSYILELYQTGLY